MRRVRAWWRAAWRLRFDAVELAGLGLAPWALWSFWSPLAGALLGAVELVWWANAKAR